MGLAKKIASRLLAQRDPANDKVDDDPLCPDCGAPLTVERGGEGRAAWYKEECPSCDYKFEQHKTPDE